MPIDYSKIIAYICPCCGKLTKREITLFDLPISGTVFSCFDGGCGEPVVSVTHKKDKYVFDVLCTVCDTQHKFTISHSGLWRKELIVLSCPQTDVGIIFIGEMDDICEELQKQNELYSEAEAEISSNPMLSVYFDIIHAINDISKSGRLICSSCGKREFDAELIDAGIKLTCRSCPASAVIPISTESLNKLLQTGTLVLE